MPRADTHRLHLDRRTVGILLVAGVIAVVGGAMVRQEIGRWRDREASIVMKRDQLARLRTLLAHAEAIRDTVRFHEARQIDMPRLLAARSAAAAGADVQSFVQEQAEASDVTINSLDVAGDAERLGDVPLVPVTVVAIGDVYGVTAWLDRLQYGPRLLEIRDLAITPNPALRGNLLQVSMTLRAPYVEAR